MFLDLIKTTIYATNLGKEELYFFGILFLFCGKFRLKIPIGKAIGESSLSTTGSLGTRESE